MAKMSLHNNENVPVLEGWVNLTEAANMLGITRQYSFKKASNGGYKTVHRVGSQPAYVVSVAEIFEIIAERDSKAAARASKAVAVK